MVAPYLHSRILKALVGLFVLSFLYFFLKSNRKRRWACAPSTCLNTHQLRLLQPAQTATRTMRRIRLSSKTQTHHTNIRSVATQSAFNLLDCRWMPIWHPFARIGDTSQTVPCHLRHPYLGPFVSLNCCCVCSGTPRLAHWWTKHAAGLQFGFVAFYSFMAANVFAWALWGTPFIEHTFLYHLHRADHRHNFSPYFLSTYLSLFSPSTSQHPSKQASSPHPSLLSPQLAVVSLLGYHLGKRDVVAAMTAQTIAFVAFNKVCTSQYFLCFLWLLPLVYPSLKVGRVETAVCVLLAWVGGQALCWHWRISWSLRQSRCLSGSGRQGWC